MNFVYSKFIILENWFLSTIIIIILIDLLIKFIFSEYFWITNFFNKKNFFLNNSKKNSLSESIFKYNNILKSKLKSILFYFFVVYLNF